VTRYVFIGAGAIGCALGGLLAQHGQDVLLVARGAHGRAMIERGLTVRCPDTTVTVAVPTVTGPEQARLTVEDVLVLTTKTQQAEAAIDQWADVPVHDRDGAVVGRAADRLPILTALNGLASEEIALRYFDRVFAVCVWCPAVMIEPGEVIVRSAPLRGIFHVGRYGGSPESAQDTALLARLRRDWDTAGHRVIPAPDVLRWKHRKLLSNVANVLQALLGDTGDTADSAEDADLIKAATVEAREILVAAGLPFPDDEESRAVWGELVHGPVPGEPDELGGSTWQSLTRGAGTVETDYLNGEIVLIARRIGRPAPINTVLTGLARRAAREGLRPGALSLDQLRTHLGR
jgi:2-dehydropantoate 2-reductase